MGELTMIAAVGEGNGLGKDNHLMWHLPDDFRRFKRLTLGHPIIMGRKTFESFPRPLSGRKHLVITRDLQYTSPFPECIIIHSLDEALEQVAKEPLAFIIGGAEIYHLAMAVATRLEITRVHGTIEADAYFPPIEERDWELLDEEFHPADARHAFAFTYLSYKRRKPS